MRVTEHIPFQHLKACPECGRMELRIVGDQKYPTEQGLDRVVLYRCPNGHQVSHRQQVVKAEGVPPKDLWEGYAT